MAGALFKNKLGRNGISAIFPNEVDITFLAGEFGGKSNFSASNELFHAPALRFS